MVARVSFALALSLIAACGGGHRSVSGGDGGDAASGGIGGKGTTDGGDAGDACDGSAATISVVLTFDDATAGATSVIISADVSTFFSAFSPLTLPHTPGQKTMAFDIMSMYRLVDGEVIRVEALDGMTSIGSGYSQPIMVATCNPIAVMVTPRAITAFQGMVSNDLDVLFVIDDARSMGALIDKAIAGFAAFVDALRQQPNGPPSLHVGVISADVGPGKFDLPAYGCPFNGDFGRLKSLPQAPCIDPPLPADQHFLSISSDGMIKNFTGTLEQAFACIARLPATGCAFSSPLKALRRALDPFNVPDTNSTFLRQQAALLVVVVADGDDCSVPDDSDLFNPTQLSLADPLGPFSTFRCNEFGHLCQINGSLAPLPRGAASNLIGCVSNETATGRLTHVADEVAFLQSLKPDPSRVWVTSFGGPVTPYSITTQVSPRNNENQPVMVPSCVQSAAEQAEPAIRLQQWTQAFGNHGSAQQVCAGSLLPAFGQVGAATDAVIHNCITNVLRDADPTTAAIEPTCTVIDNFVSADQHSFVPTPLPQCTSAASTTACWHIDPGGPCGNGSLFVPERPVGSMIPMYTQVTCDVCPPRAVLPGCP